MQRGINPHVGFVAGWLILLDYVFVPSLLYSLVAAWCVELVPAVPFVAWIILFVVINTTINVRGIESTAKADWVMFIIEIGILLFFIIMGLKFVFSGGGAGELSINPFYQPGKINLGFIASATSIACLSFLVFDGISTLAEETVNPEKTVGRGILISLVAIGIIFILQTYVATLFCQIGRTPIKVQNSLMLLHLLQVNASRLYFLW
ncbi:putrescine importer PuuP [Clostridium magnum DSM 2767]|uniref:Putrescine importer PuuP n=1 Tax=Clostridium magnum DSM 2767 TaxID=1121326 RepID=A0A161YP29_9CLOT|nr:APC family permease [Clostridium magnum]KZL92502.1 putrescine importer PuuP [Clostridium magnum DSM 2767]SHI22978.1 Amino acid permease [Clostridium magnum DSM 2767]